MTQRLLPPTLKHFTSTDFFVSCLRIETENSGPVLRQLAFFSNTTNWFLFIWPRVAHTTVSQWSSQSAQAVCLWNYKVEKKKKTLNGPIENTFSDLLIHPGLQWSSLGWFIIQKKLYRSTENSPFSLPQKFFQLKLILCWTFNTFGTGILSLTWERFQWGCPLWHHKGLVSRTGTANTYFSSIFLGNSLAGETYFIENIFKVNFT